MNKLNTLYRNVDSNNKIKEELPNNVCKPFDKNRSGIVLGEGSAMYILESLENAIKRKAKIYGEIKGFSTNGDSYHLTKPSANGEGGFLAMANALNQSNISPNEVDLISCHATATDVGDLSELKAVLTLFGSKIINNRKESNSLRQFLNEYCGDRYKEFDKKYEEISKEENLDKDLLKNKFILANKAQLGHLLGAAGSVELAIAILCMNEGIVLDNYNTTNPITDLINFRYKDDESKFYIKKDLNTIVKNSFAFGGVNSSIVLTKYKN